MADTPTPMALAAQDFVAERMSAEGGSGVHAAELFFLREEHRRRLELEGDLEQTALALQAEHDRVAGAAAEVQLAQRELARERAALQKCACRCIARVRSLSVRRREMAARKKAESERDRLAAEKLVVEEEKNKVCGRFVSNVVYLMLGQLAGARSAVERELGRERKRLVEMQAVRGPLSAAHCRD
jgi:hypothetical protein